MGLNKIQTLMFENKLSEAINLLDRIPFEQNFQYLILKSKLLIALNRLEEANSILSKFDDITLTIEESFVYYLTKSSFFWSIKDLFQFSNSIERAEGSLFQLRNQNNAHLSHIIADFYNSSGILNLVENNIELAIEYYEKSLSLNLKLENQVGIGSNYNGLAVSYINLGDFSRATSYLKKALKIFQEINDDKSLQAVLNNLGGILQTKGNLISAMEYFEKSLDLSTKTQNLDIKAKSLNNVGNILLNQGYFDKAFEYYILSIDIKNKIKDIPGLAATYHNLGRLYRIKKDYDQSLFHLKIALQYHTEINNEIQIAFTLIELIATYLEINKLEKAKLLLNSIGRSDNIENKQISLLFLFGKALILKQSKLFPYKLAARDLFKRISETNEINFEVTVSSILNYLEIVISTYLDIGARYPIEELRSVSNKLYKKAQSNNSVALVIESLILKAKISQIESNLDEMELYLVQAQILAFENNIFHLLEKIENLIIHFNTNFSLSSNDEKLSEVLDLISAELYRL